jgi:hypothetical protein
VDLNESGLDFGRKLDLEVVIRPSFDAGLVTSDEIDRIVVFERFHDVFDSDNMGKGVENGAFFVVDVKKELKEIEKQNSEFGGK